MKKVKVKKLPNEKWKRVYIKGERTNYKISTYGRAMNAKRKKLLKPWKDTNGYPQITVRLNGKSIPVSIHRLIALHFIDNPHDKPQVNHINGRKDFNYLWNLEWCTEQENTIHAIKTGLLVITPEKRITQNKINEKEATKVCKLLEKHYTVKQVYEKMFYTSISIGIIECIKNRVTWRHISKDYNWDWYFNDKKFIKYSKSKYAKQMKWKEYKKKHLLAK